jgi:hypothetical protein
LSALEYHDGRYVANTELHGEVAFRVYVHFAYHSATFEVIGEFRYDRSNHAAGSAPLGPEVYEHGLVRVKYKFLEVCGGQF